MSETMIETAACRIAIAQSSGSGLPVLMIHGNSSSKEVFRNQYNGKIGETFQCIAMDLPGHGASEDAKDPEAAYTMPGYADVALEVMDVLGIERYAVLGWSLGGHIGLEIVHKSNSVCGLMITGTPPVGQGPESLAAGFLPSEHMHLAGQRDFTEAEIDAYSRATCGINAPFEDFLRDAVARTDGRARAIMFASFMAGKGCNQQDVAMHSSAPLAIVNGGDEPFVNNEFVGSLAYDNLWENTVHIIDGAGHAPFWETPETFDVYLERFLNTVE